MPLAIDCNRFILRFSIRFRDSMQLYYFLAVILSLCCGSLPESTRSLPHAAGFTVLLIGTWWCLCLMAARIISNAIERGELPHEIGFELFERQTSYLRWLSIGLIVLCLGGFGLGSCVDELPIVANSLTLQSLVLLLPALAIMVGLWIAEFAFATQVGVGEAGVVAMMRHVSELARASIGWILAPLLGLMLLFDIASTIQPPAWFPAWIGWTFLMVLVLASAPLFVRLWLTTKSIPADMQPWLRSLLAAAGEESLGITIWDTGGRTHNAMVAGFLGRFRTLVLSDRLITGLTRPELAMVILHELAHVKRRHIPLRVMSLLPAWLLGYTFERWTATQSFSLTLANWGALLGSGLSIVLTIVVMRLVSYRIELDADHYATTLAPRLAAHCVDVPTSREDAAMTLASALVRVTNNNDAAQEATWLHPGIRQRITELGVIG